MKGSLGKDEHVLDLLILHQTIWSSVPLADEFCLQDSKQLWGSAKTSGMRKSAAFFAMSVFYRVLSGQTFEP